MFHGVPSHIPEPRDLSSTLTYLERSESVPRPVASKYAVLMTLAGIERTLVQGGNSWPGAGWVAPFEQASQAIPTKGPPIGFRFRLASQTAQNPSTGPRGLRCRV